MSELYNRIETLCELKKISITQMCKGAGASRGSLGDLANNRIQSLSATAIKKISDFFSVPETFILNGTNYFKIIDALCSQNGINISELYEDISLDEKISTNTKQLSSTSLLKLADYFHVYVDFFNREFDDRPCPKCGFMYYDHIEGDFDAHEDNHLKWAKAVKKFGFCWSYKYREEVKAKARTDLQIDPDISAEQFADLYILIFKALFSRSVEGSDYSLSHISFETYCAAMIKQKNNIIPNIREDAFQILREKYGINDLIPMGSYYKENFAEYYAPFSVQKAYDTKNDNIDVKSNKKKKNTESDTIKKYRALDKHGKEIADFIINKEYDRCTAPVETAPIPTIKIKHSEYKASAGFGFDLEDRDEWDEIDIPNTPEARKADFAVTIYGNSMEPIYYNGDIVLIQTQDRIDIGETGVFVVNGQGFIKQYGGDRLISANSDYDDIVLSEGDYFKCVGKVIGVVKAS